MRTDKKTPIEVSIGIPQHIRFRVHGVIVQPTSNRLDLIAEDESSQTYDLIARMATSIVERLPHTPIRAVGHNLSFDLEDGERFKAVPGTDLDSKASVHFYSEHLSDEQIRLGFMEPTRDIGETVRALVRAGSGWRIAVLPEGPTTIPYLRG